uniref:Serine/threonine-protein phosphatase 5 isoform X1 n=1 Tax=Rhizophora mucronata TaxID=61149 RepID=A0A2P2KHV4_RHIMU
MYQRFRVNNEYVYYRWKINQFSSKHFPDPSDNFVREPITYHIVKKLN